MSKGAQLSIHRRAQNNARRRRKNNFIHIKTITFEGLVSKPSKKTFFPCKEKINVNFISLQTQNTPQCNIALRQTQQPGQRGQLENLMEKTPQLSYEEYLIILPPHQDNAEIIGALGKTIYQGAKNKALCTKTCNVCKTKLHNKFPFQVCYDCQNA
jgi:hypothetical protein